GDAGTCDDQQPDHQHRGHEHGGLDADRARITPPPPPPEARSAGAGAAVHEPPPAARAGTVNLSFSARAVAETSISRPGMGSRRRVLPVTVTWTVSAVRL